MERKNMEKLEVYLQTTVEGANGLMVKVGEVTNLDSISISGNLPAKLNLKAGRIVFYLPKEVEIAVNNGFNWSGIKVKVPTK